MAIFCLHAHCNHTHKHSHRVNMNSYAPKLLKSTCDSEGWFGVIIFTLVVYKK